MASKREEKRAALQERLVVAAEARIVSGGLSGLKARDVTADAGCALGALYTAFDDLDTLVLHVNSRTLARLGRALEAASEGHDSPEAVLQSLAAAYVDFALSHRALWVALFEHRMADDRPIPAWHHADNAVLIAQIVAPLARLRPDLDEAALLLRARTTFAAVHGVVALALEGRFVGVPEAALRAEVSALVAALTRGITPQSAP